MSKKEFVIEYFTSDEEIIKEYKDLFRPFKQRFRYTIYYNTLLSLGLFYYFKNAISIGEKYYPNKRKGFHNMILISTLHAIVFSFLLIGGNTLVLGINPIEFNKRYKELDRKMMEKDPYFELTKINEVLELYNKFKNK